jgi:hypothetical protein
MLKRNKIKFLLCNVVFLVLLSLFILPKRAGIKISQDKYCQEYMFLLAGNIMPGTEKLWGELLFPEEKQFFQGKQMFFSEFFCARHNVFQSEGYIFLGFHPLTYHKPLHFDRFCFILPLQILLITWPLGRPPAERPGIPLATMWLLLK